MQGSQTSLPVFTEIHYVPTDDLGQVNLVIGQGTATTGAFSSIDWSLGSYYLGIELDTGSGYVAMGTTQLLSVPYALYAENSGNSTPTTPNLETVLAENNSANNQQIKDLQDPTDAQDAVTKAYVDTEVLNNVQNIEEVLTQGNDANGLQLKGIADPTDAQDAVTLAYITQLETSLQDLQNQLQEQNQNIDNDFDGFSENNGDCDDTNAQVYSGAEEICDGLDNDCDGFVDEDAGSIFYQDSDGDGFGGSTTIQSCEQPSGYVAQGGDCDDSDATINPNAVEVCDGIDNNCDGVVDEGLINIITQPLAEQTVCFGEVPSPLVLDYDNENETPSFQWYSTTTCDTSDTSLPIVGATSSSYTPPSNTVGSFYYFVVLNDGSCSLTSDCALVNINPSAQVNQVDDITVNSGETTQPIVFSTSNTSGTTTYTWIIDNISIGVSSSSGIGDVPAFTAINTSTTPIVGTIIVTPTFTNGGISCEGPPMSFTITVNPAAGSITDIDGNTYDYLTYGTQQWTVKNAEMVTYRDGTPIPQVTDDNEWLNLTTGAWCYYYNDPTKPILYNWYAVMGIHDTDPNTPNKEFSPEGWHVPTHVEWNILENYLIANGYNYDGTTTGNKIAKAMASTTGWTQQPIPGAIGNDQSLNNSSGFNAFPGSTRFSSNGLFGSEGSYAKFWSSTESSASDAWYRYLSNDYSLLYRGNDTSKRFGFSVRFVRD